MISETEFSVRVARALIFGGLTPLKGKGKIAVIFKSVEKRGPTGSPHYLSLRDAKRMAAGFPRIEAAISKLGKDDTLTLECPIGLE